MSRINNDMRFNRDRAPYKTRIEAGVKGHYVSVGAQGMYVGAGIYRPEPAVLRELRQAIAADVSGKKLQTIVAALRRKGYTCDARVVGGPAARVSRRSPARRAAADEGHPRRPHAGAGHLSTAKALGQVKKVMTDLAPFNTWLRAYVGGARS
jgi:hypothetical protein